MCVCYIVYVSVRVYVGGCAHVCMRVLVLQGVGVCVCVCTCLQRTGCEMCTFILSVYS